MHRGKRGGWRAVGLAAVPLLAATLLAAHVVHPGPAPPSREPAWDGGDGDADEGAFVYAALGDSLTRGVGAGGLGENLSASWATGRGEDVESVATRLPDHPRVPGDVHAVNLAESGARAAALPTQARLAAQADPDLVTVVVGANDACTRDPPVTAAAFRTHVRQAFDVLRTDAPSAVVVVYAFPEPVDLRDVWGTDRGAVGTWAANGTCSAVLAPDRDAADVAMARERGRALNAVLAEEAARAGFRYSDAPRTAGFDRAHVSTWDFFHPSTAGQARLADVAWPAVAQALGGPRG